MTTGAGSESIVEIARQSLSIRFEGPATDTHAIDVRVLAPSLVAWSGVFQAAHRAINPAAPDVALAIEAAEDGSFIARLLLILEGSGALFASDPVSALANLKAIVIDPMRGAISLIRRRGEIPDDELHNVQEETLPNGDLKVAWPDGPEVTYPADAVKAGRSIQVQRELAGALDPLGRPGFERITITSADTPDLTLIRDDIDAVRTEADRERPAPEPMANTITMNLDVLAPALDGKKWRVSDGASNFWVAITDPAFQARIEAGEPFAKGDILRSVVEFVQPTDGTMSLQRRVVEVLDHRPAAPRPPQGSLIEDQ